jgi:SNF2 family DNA or RNA helicase
MENFRSNLLSYQKKAFEKLKDLDTACLFLEPGLGKTITAIAIANEWMRSDKCDSIFIFTKKHLVQTWNDEFKMHTLIKPITPSLRNGGLRYSFFPKNSVHILHYQAGFKHLQMIKFIVSKYKIGIILDECQVIKNQDSSITGTISQIIRFAKKRLIMSGTPVANRPFDLISQLAVLGLKLPGVLSTKAALDIPRNDIRSQFAKLELNISSMKKRFEKITFSYTKKQLELDGLIVRKNESLLTLKLGQTQKKIYEQQLPSNLDFANTSQKNRRAWIVKTIIKLCKVCSGIDIKKANIVSQTTKEQVLIKEAKKSRSRKESFIIWTSFVKTADNLTETLKCFNVFKIHGMIPQAKRDSIINEFKSTPGSILVATMQSCKEGLNLQNATKCFFHDLSFRLDDMLQAQDRIHRINQTKPVYIFYMVYKNTIEEWIYKLFQLKKHFSIDIFNNSKSLNENFIFHSSNSLRAYLR